MKKTVDVIIPTYKPGSEFVQLLYGLRKQTYPIQTIIVVNTDETYWKPEYETYVSHMKVYHVTPQNFDHGGTRDFAARMSQADYLLYMTQDAVPAEDTLVEQLVLGIQREPMIGAAYGRQLPAADCNLAEQYTRTFNYPKESRIKRLEDLSTLGIKTYFCSNVCAMYDRERYLALGGFVKKTIFNEDMIYAANLIKSGYGVAYVGEAEVIHSHNYTAKQQFHRNFDLGVSQADHPEIFASVSSEGEGIRLVKSTAAWLCKQHRPWLVIPLVWNSGWKYLGYLMGKRYKKLPKWLILRWTMNRNYWI